MRETTKKCIAILLEKYKEEKLSQEEVMTILDEVIEKSSYYYPYYYPVYPTVKPTIEPMWYQTAPYCDTDFTTTATNKVE